MASLTLSINNSNARLSRTGSVSACARRSVPEPERVVGEGGGAPLRGMLIYKHNNKLTLTANCDFGHS